MVKSLRDFLGEKEKNKGNWIDEAVSKINVQEFASELSAIISEKGSVPLVVIERYIQEIAGKKKIRHFNPNERALVKAWLSHLGFEVVGDFRLYVTEKVT